MQDFILETCNLTKDYKQTKALDNVNVKIERGHLYGFIGQNGAGKTTFLRLVAGLAYPTSGGIRLFGQDGGEKQLAKARRRIGSLIEVPAFYPSMTAQENLEIQRIGAGIAERDIVNRLLARVGLSDTGKKKAKDFSLGMKQRLAIAMALLSEPEFLLLDEPINGLDPISIVELRELLKCLCTEQNTTIIVSSHNLAELYQLATDYIFIDKGRIVEEVTSLQLDEKCKRHILLSVDKPSIAVTVIEQQLKTNNYQVLAHGVIKLFDYLEDVGTVSETLAKNGLILTRISTEGESLESYFINLVGGEHSA